jgi:hypothetical protein
MQSIWIAKNPDGYHKLSTNKACADQTIQQVPIKVKYHSTLAAFTLNYIVC